jgi:hypothetical protein
VVRELYVVSLVAALTLLTSGCPAAGDEPHRPPPLVVEPLADPPEPRPAPVIEEVIEISTPGSGVEPIDIPVTLAIATPTRVPWREVVTFAEPSLADLRFIPIASGIVARSSAGVHELDDAGHLVLRSGLTVPEGTLLGHWPNDAWAIETKSATPTAEAQPRSEYQVLSFDPKQQQWVAQPYHGKDRWIGEPLAVRKGWHAAGLLIREGSTLTRIGSVKPAPDVGMRMGKLLLDTFETTSGLLYTVSQRPTGVHVQGDCPDLECVKRTAKKLPFGTDWSFSMQVPRQRKSLTIAARVDLEGSTTNYLLHFETGGWKLETLDRTPHGLWANSEGGLWAQLGDALWYRSPGGEWVDVALPDGAGELSAALLEDGSELWIAATIDGRARVYATSASPEPINPR